MHSTEGNTEGITFHHNGDYSGEVWININETAEWGYKRDPAVEWTPKNEEFNIPGYWTVRIPFEDLKGLVAEYVRSNKIYKLEEADDDKLLGLQNGLI